MALNKLGRLARVRSVTAANAATETEVLRAGEPGFVSDTGDLRVGDGTTAFSALKSVRNHRRVRTVTATGNVNADDEVVIVNSGSATTQTLPAAASNSGRAISITNRGAGVVTVGNQTGGPTLAQGVGGRYVSDGTTWYPF